GSHFVGVSLVQRQRNSVHLHHNPALHDKKRLVFDPVIVEWAALAVEQEEKLAAVGVLPVVDDPVLDLADMREVMQAEVDHQRLAGRHGETPGFQHAGCFDQSHFPLRALQFKIQRPGGFRLRHAYPNSLSVSPMASSTMSMPFAAISSSM